MDDIVDMLFFLIPMIIVIFITSYCLKVISGMSGDPKKLERVFNELDHNINPGILSNSSVKSNAVSKVCKNCKTNKALDDGFDLCGMCKENPKWWMVE